MGGSTTVDTNTQSQSINEIPQWVQNAGQANYGFAQQVATQPLQQYQGQMIADVSPQMQQAWDLAANSGNVGQGAQAGAQSALLNAANYTPQNITAGQLANTNLSPYMNPYTQDVINKTLPIMQQGLALQQNQQQNAANAANAFGGSRQAIQQGVTQAQGALNEAQMAAQLNQANFQQAQAGATGDINRALAAAQANQQAGLTANQQGIVAGSALGTLGTQQMQNNIANFGMLTAAGGAQEQQQQNQINAQIAKLQQAQSYPQQQLGVLESALGMTPYNTGTSGSSASQQTTTQNNPAAMALGGLETLGGLFSAPAGGTSAMGGLMSMFGSDRRLKTDIAKVGRHPAGVDLYAYRYKGDPKHYPKVIGPMAEDVAKIAPGAVSEIPGSGGRRAVHMGMLGALAGGLPPSSPGVGRAIGMLSPSAVPGRLSSAATPPSGPVGARPRRSRVPIMGALSA